MHFCRWRKGVKGWGGGGGMLRGVPVGGHVKEGTDRIARYQLLPPEALGGRPVWMFCATCRAFLGACNTHDFASGTSEGVCAGGVCRGNAAKGGWSCENMPGSCVSRNCFCIAALCRPCMLLLMLLLLLLFPVIPCGCL